MESDYGTSNNDPTYRVNLQTVEEGKSWLTSIKA